MAGIRVAVIGHVVLEPKEIPLPKSTAAREQVVKVNNYLNVVTPNGTMMEDMAYFSRMSPDAPAGRLSIWDIFLTAGLLLSSHLRRLGCNVRLFNSIEADTAETIVGEIKAFNPEVIVLCTTMVLTQPQFLRISHFIRQIAPQAFIVAGGQHIYTTLLYMSDTQRTEYLTATRIDGFINDPQGEAALAELCKAKAAGSPLDGIKTLIWRKEDGTIVQNERVPELNDINSTPLDFVDVPEGSVVHMRTARSCSFKCAFCSYPTIAGPLALMEMSEIKATFQRLKERNVKALIFADDTFNVPAPRFEAILDAMIAMDLNIPWYSFLRCQFINERLVEKMRASKCAGVFLGIESGSDGILTNMKKGAVVKFYRNGISWLKSAGISTVGAFVVGFPGETDASAAETQEFIDNSGLDYYFIQPFYYLHHAPIHKRADEFGLTGNGLFWKHNTMDWQTAVKHINRMFLEIRGATFINPDNNLWELAYLRSKGVTDEQFLGYRKMINGKIAEQMLEYGLVDPEADGVMGITSRHDQRSIGDEQRS